MRGQTTSMRALAAALLIAALAACGDSSPTNSGPTPVASVRVTPSQHELLVGQTVELRATTLAGGGDELEDRDVAWRSENSTVATVNDQGLVEAKAAGSATIVATSEGKEGRAAIAVSVIPVASVQLDVAEFALIERQTRQLRATPKDGQGNDLPNRGVTWSSADLTVATVSEAGLVTAVGAGTTRITATSEGKDAAAQVTVSRVPVASLTLDIATLELEQGASRRLVATAKDADGNVLAGRDVQWTSSQPTIVRVGGDGTVTALAAGSSVITASAENKTATAAVRVPAPLLAFDLMYDSRTAVQNFPEIYRLDISTPGADPVKVPQLAGVSDVTPSPDGSKIAFVGEGSSHSVIAVANRDGSDVVILTTGPGSADQPAWSPDGTKIAYRRWSAGGPPGEFNPADIWVMHADGSNQANLTNDGGAGSEQSPAWSPRLADGSYRIVYSHETRGADDYMRATLISMRADGADKRPVTDNGDSYDDEPTWSPDGSAIVFARTGPAHDHQLLVVSVETGSVRALIALDPAGRQYAPAWSPDGQLIAFTSNHEIEGTTYAYQVYTVRPDGTQLVRRTSLGEDKHNPAWIKRP